MRSMVVATLKNHFGKRYLRPILAGWLALLAAFGGSTARADEAQWIWSPAYEKEMAPPGNCYFRKTFNLDSPEQGEIQIGCDDSYELYVNGQQIGAGKNWKVLDVFDITKALAPGRNTIAVKAVNDEQGSAGLVARVVIKQQGNTDVTYSTDDSWKTSLKEFQHWQKIRFDDSRWLAARSFGALGATLPWGNEFIVAGASSRFKPLADFRVKWVIDAKQTGSLIAMAFDEFGQILAARENGPLLIIRDENKDGTLDTVTTFCDEIKNCQGILSVSGRVFAVGQGPKGTGLYRLSDTDQDGKVDEIELLVKFSGEMGEHGPHALALGPDGLIYMVAGNFSHVENKIESSSPYHHPYEGDLNTPRYEDASGHAVGIKSPGGTILRTDTNGTAVELVAGGLQNPYDLAFNREGELFTCDSDMEWDLGMSWYRPTRANHVVAGAEFGWRSGWSKWPDTYLDSLPPVLETGRGSPAGIEFYNHFMYPQRFHNALFVCDWSRGRILAIKPKPHGASYKATSEVFLEGRPLNVTDIAVGPDGWLYFCTGGRDTEGGIYRIVWNGQVPPEVKQLGKGLSAALRQPQLQSAYARQQIALVKQQMGKNWAVELTAAAEDSQTPLEQRVRALDLMQLFGPAPTSELLVKLSREPQAPLRTKAAYLMGIHGDEATQSRLAELLSDGDLAVTRTACEALVRAGQQAPVEKLMPLLASSDRFVAWAARRALEQMPPAQWQSAVLKAAEPRAFLNGSVGLLVLDPTPKTARAILDRASKLMDGYLNDPDFLDLLRVVQLAFIKGHFAGEDFPRLRTQLGDEYPSQDPRMNRELVRLLAYLQSPIAAERFVQQLKGEGPAIDKLHVAVHAPFLHAGWTTPLKLEVLKFYEEARTLQGGHSYGGYIENVSRDFFADLNEQERQVVLADGAKWPSSALSVLFKLPDNPDEATLEQIQELDRQVKNIDSDAARKLRIGIAAVLGGSHNPQAMAYLREVFENEPERRVHIAMGLAQQPDGDNWPLLVRALSFVEGQAAQEVLVKLAQVEQVPDKPEPYREAIVRGLMLGKNGGSSAVALLENWTGQKLSKPDDSPEEALAAWQEWFANTYPDEPEAKLPVESEQNNWTYQELYSYLNGPQGTHGDATHGELVFQKAQCAKCHRFGDRGETVGPDLTTLSQRFQRKEILESILFPSQVISDQYATQTVVTKDGRTLIGMVAPAGDGSLVVLQSSGEKVTLNADDVEETTRNKQSVMPDGLLNTLTLEEVADLFAYLTKPTASEIARRPRGKSNPPVEKLDLR